MLALLKLNKFLLVYVYFEIPFIFYSQKLSHLEGETYWHYFAGNPFVLGKAALKGNIYINDHDNIWIAEKKENNNCSYKI